MKRQIHSGVGLLLLFVVFTMLSMGCSNGGDDEGSGIITPEGNLNTLFDGTYLTGEIGLNSTPYSVRSEVVGYGDGHLEWNDITAPHGSGSFPITVAADGRIMVDGADNGIISPDGNAFATADTDAMNALGLRFGLKKSTGMTDSNLSGEYIIGAIQLSPDPAIEPILITSSGLGTFDWEELLGPDTGTMDYSVDDDGTLTIGGIVQGLVGLNGNLFVAVSTDDVDSETTLRVGIRKSSGLTNASLSGSYIMCQMGIDADLFTSIMDVSSNGSGTLTFSTIANSTGADGNGSVDYSVAADGVLSVDGQEAGIVSEDGNIFMILDLDVDYEALMIGIRKSS